jgi:hypothetical protein
MPLSAEERQRFARDGFLVKQAFYSPDEVDVLSRVSRGAARREDGGGRGGTAQDEGRQSEFWMIGGGVEERGIYNAVCFGERMVSAVSALLEDEVTLYHRCAAFRAAFRAAMIIEQLYSWKADIAAAPTAAGSW